MSTYLYAPFLIANGDPNNFNTYEVYFAFGAANADGVEHIRSANGAVEFEDLFGGGDNDFNDMVVTFEVLAKTLRPWVTNPVVCHPARSSAISTINWFDKGVTFIYTEKCRKK